MLGDLVQTTSGKWITHPPMRCPNGHPLGPNQVLVGHQACLGHGGGHTTWTCRTCDQTVYGPSTEHPLHGARRACGRADLHQSCLTKRGERSAGSTHSEPERNRKRLTYCSARHTAPWWPGGSSIEGRPRLGPCDGRLKERSVARRFPPRCGIPIRHLATAGYVKDGGHSSHSRRVDFS